MLGEQLINMPIFQFLWLNVPRALINQDTVCRSCVQWCLISLSDVTDCCKFYGHIRPTASTVALLPADPCNSEAEDLSDPQDENDAHYVPPPREDLLPPPKKRRNMNWLVEVSSHLYQNPSPPAKSKQRKWVKKDIPTFTVPEPVFTVPEAVHIPFAYFKRLFTD